jgi:preprotein translocase subunit SecY
MLSMWFAELITKEDLGNGSSMIIFINIIGGLPANITEFNSSLNNSSSINNFVILFLTYAIYLIVVAIIVLVQDSYKRVNIVSARQLNFNYLEQSPSSSELKNSYIPIKLQLFNRIFK